MARQLGAGVNRIVIDAGHGGKDPGTSAGSLREKDIALDIAKRVRDDDLEERGIRGHHDPGRRTSSYRWSSARSSPTAARRTSSCPST